MLKKLMIGAGVGAAILFSAAWAQASTFSIIGGSAEALNGFDLTSTTGLTDGDIVLVFNSSSDGTGTGLFLDGAPATVTFTYLGSEAAATNEAVELEGTESVLFNNDTSVVGDTSTVTFSSDGALPFGFETESETCSIWFIICWQYTTTTEGADNDGTIDGDLSIALFQESATSVIALFGDGRGDHDYDDMAIRISIVPLPPALLLFGAALLGLGWLSRKRST
ncbi:hypothetical protein [Sneathiella chinensis]|uniref:PEP-CTERM protein-sorting domain-containing protein n=1 Tax=Sneathiella chinensis TaxID=349750 RepID=A0ABQ5U5S8_9PROT|nr:hypothetical protein [Sneathiella chinensis]GLQ07489.1 hypothetical protein GCM10007924_27100 [Sneathiella chinensis]